MKRPVILEPCDILLSRSETWLGRTIRRLTRSIGESRTKVNHVGLVVNENSIEYALVIEALETTKLHRLFDQYFGKKTKVAIYRPKNLSDIQKAEILAKAKSYVGRAYGYAKIIAHALDHYLFGVYLFRRLTKSDKYPICSWLVAKSFAVVGLDFGVRVEMAQPDDIWDFVTSNPDKYECIRELDYVR